MEYSAGLTSKLFWFIESKKTAQYIEEGMSRDQIKEIAIEENIYQVAKEYRTLEILNGTYSRLVNLPLEMMKMLNTTDVSTAKIIVLTAVMQSNRFFFEFVNEVYREKLILGEREISDRDINVFFANKISQSDVIAKWTSVSIKKLKSTIPRYLFEAGLLSDPSKDRKILEINIDYKLRSMYEESNMMPYYYAITGER